MGDKRDCSAHNLAVHEKVYFNVPLRVCCWPQKKEVANFLRKHGGKTGEELKAAGK
ncbi:hypothetical protein OAG73_01545 [bacterium]|nr:hypothetical protein [bacterium]